MILLGVDIGGTKIAAGIVDAETGAVLYSERTPTHAQEGGAAILARALTHAQQVVSSANVSVEAVGIGAGGQIDYRTGIVLSATNILPGWAGTRLAESFAQAFGVSAYADNDVNAFALGEHRFGAGRGATDAVFLALGTGVGGAIVTNGKLHRGKRGTGGELGHLLIAPSKGGTLEDNTCGAKVVTYFQMLAKENEPDRTESRYRTELRLPSEVSLETIDGYSVGFAAMHYPEAKSAVQAVNLVGHRLGFALASLANILDTERFVIGGGLSDLGDLILEPARNVFAEHVLPLYADTQIVPAALGTHSSVVGAACVALAGLERDIVD